MTLSREQKLAALGHSDVFVRSTFLSLFGEDRDRGPDVTQHAVSAVDRYGWHSAFEFPHQLRDLALDAETMPWLLRQVGDDYSYENADVTFMEIPSSAFSSMSFPGHGREGGW